MHIYDAEKSIANLMADTTVTTHDGSKAFATTLTAPIKSNSDNDFKRILALLKRNLASVKSVEELVGIDQPDLALIVSVLASVGWNENDDIFIPEELWKSRSTAAHKPINDMHDGASVLGHIIESYGADKDGNKLETMPDGEFDVEVAGVLYRAVPETRQRVIDILSKAETGEIFVSMEAWFPNFSYGLLEPSSGTTHVVERTEDTAFLTKHLRIYGGEGVYEGFQVGRVLKDFIFGGKGIVDEPANPESVIRVAASAVASKSFENNELDKLPEGGVISMDKELKELQSKLEEAQASLEERDAKIAELTKSVEDANTSQETMDELSAKVEELTNFVAEATEKVESLEKEKAETDAKMTEVSERADKAEAELAEISKTEKGRERLAKLSKVREIENEDDTLAELKDMSDETFDVILKYAGSVTSEESANAEEASKECDCDGECSCEKDGEAEASLENAEENSEADFQAGTESDGESELKVALATARALCGQTEKE